MQCVPSSTGYAAGERGMKSPKQSLLLGLPCKGGKNELLYALLPLTKYLALESPKRAFLDICGGGGKLACNVAAGFLYTEVLYNEYERGVAALMACLTDEVLTRKVISLVDSLVRLSRSYGPRNVFNTANAQRNKPDLDKVLAAAYTFYCIYGSYGNDRQNFSAVKEAEYFHDKQRQKVLLEYPARIHRMIVTCGSCFDVLERYIAYDDIVSFIDPPYYNTKAYENDWSQGDYSMLRKILLQTKNQVILCGRSDDQQVYDCLLTQGWYRTSMGKVGMSSNCHDGSLAEEFIWTNFRVPRFINHIVEEKEAERGIRREEILPKQ